MKWLDNNRILESGTSKSLPVFLKNLPTKHYRFYGSGREALFDLIKEKFSQVDSDKPFTVLVPGFLAEGLWLPFKRSGWEIVYYKLDERGEPDWNDIKQKSHSNPDLCIFIHLFGIENNGQKFRDLLPDQTILIEDFAQSYFTPELGLKNTVGDFLLFSLPKLIGTIDGSLLISRTGFHSKNQAKSFSFSKAAYTILRQFALWGDSFYNKFFQLDLLKISKFKVKVWNALSYRILLRYCHVPHTISGIGKRQFLKTDHLKVIQKRKVNLTLYLAHLKNPAFKFFNINEKQNLPLMGFPVLVEERDRLIQYLKKNKISGTVFKRWLFLSEAEQQQHSSTLKIYQMHFLFPIHQKLTEVEVMRIINIANKF